MVAPVAIGVDNGGTWIRLKGLDAKGRCIWSLKKPSPSVENLPRFLRKTLRRFHGKLPALAVGSRGVWKKSKRQAVKRALRGVAKTIVVMSDVEAAWLAAFGTPHPHPLPFKGRGRAERAAINEGEGIIVIAGTGSIAYGRKAGGTFGRAGGLGPEKGDEGSGYWIGRQWLLQTGRDRELKKSVRLIASLVPKVLARARKKDPIALSIIHGAQKELATLVESLSIQLGLKIAPVSWAGSVLGDPWFRNGFFRALGSLTVRRQPARTDAATALAIKAMSTTHS